MTQFIPLIVIVLLIIVCYLWGQREKRNKDVVADATARQESAVVGEYNAPPR